MRKVPFTLPALALALCAGTTAPRALPAQLTFAPPAAPVDVGRYQHVEECLAASARVRDSVESWAGIWMDTLAVEEQRKPQASFAPSREAARRCADNLPQADRELADFAPYFELHLRASRDDRAEALLERRLAAIVPAAVAERVAVLDSVINIALISKPARLPLAERALDLRDQHDSIVPGKTLLSSPLGLMVTAQMMGDTAAALRAARRMIRLDERATPAARERAEGRVPLLFLARTRLDMDSALVALRTRGTDAYVAIRRDSWAKASGERGEALLIPIGEQAPEIEAGVWVGDRGSGAARPTKGRLSLIAFVSPRCDNECPAAFAVIRRMAERFPELEVTLMTSTSGHVNPLLTPTVAEEAAVLRESLVAGNRLPGVLAVEDARPWNLPAPDGRRIEVPTPNEESYSFGASWPVRPFHVYLVDRDGRIIEHQSLATGFGATVGAELMSSMVQTLLAASQDGAAGGAR